MPYYEVCFLQGTCTHLRHYEHGLLADALQFRERVCAHDLEASTIAPDFEKVIGLARIPSVLIQPLVDPCNGRVIAVLVAADKSIQQVSAIMLNDVAFNASDECVPRPSWMDAQSRVRHALVCCVGSHGSCHDHWPIVLLFLQASACRLSSMCCAKLSC